MEGTPLRTYFQAAFNATLRVVKASGGRLGGIEISNPNTVSEWCQIFDADEAADVTLGTTTPKLSLAIPKGASATDVGVMDKLWKEGVDFNIGIVMACTTTVTGSTGPTSNLALNVMFL